MERSPNRESQRQPMQRRHIFTGANRFEFDETKIPAGMVYGWKRATLAGQEDAENLIMAEMNGWVPVPAGRHPELSGLRAEKDAEIRRGGLVLMEQPKEYQAEAREMDDFAARHQVESQISRLSLETKRAGARPRIGRRVEAIEPEAIE